MIQTLNTTTNSSSDTETLYDSYGRVSRVEVANGQSTNPWYQVDSCYDASGLLQFQPISYQGTGWGTPKHCSGAGTTYTYDALGRVVSTQTSDGTATTQYTNRAVLTSDVNGVKRITQYDLLGRISSVCEISSSTLGLEAPVNCGADIAGTGFRTLYAYDLANRKTTITQGGQQRTFTTDAAGRTIDVTEPERGETAYTYLYNTTGLLVTRKRPKANQSSPTVLTKTTTQYDTLGRIVSVTYDDGTPTKTFAYDTNASWVWTGFNPTNLKGRLYVSKVAGASTAAITRSYDISGRINSMHECVPSGCGNGAYDKVLNFSYDLAGNLISESDAAAGTIAYGRSPAGEITSITNQTYTNSYNPPNLVSNVTNGPYGPINYQLGNATSVVQSYDTLGRGNGGWLCTGSSGIGSTSNCPGSTQIYGYSITLKGVNVTGICDTVQTLCVAPGYDEFNRLKSQTVFSGTGANFAWVYDRYGNRLQQNVTSGSGPQPQMTVSTTPPNNRINVSGYMYDAAGNLTNDTYHGYTYDAEGNVTQVDGGSTAKYVYDALNQRVRVDTPTTSTSTEYLYDYAGRRISSWLVNGAGGVGNEGRIYWDGKQLAYRALDGTTYFEHKDYIGTERMRTSYNGSVAGTFTSLPFGDSYTLSTSNASADQENNHFALLDHDAESSAATDHAQFRQYFATAGRWMSPDPYDGSYDFSNPQSLNRYTYGSNNPLTAVDPSGQFTCTPSDGSPAEQQCDMSLAAICNNTISAACGYAPSTPTEIAMQAIAAYESYSLHSSYRDEAVYVRALRDGYWTGGTDKNYDYWTGTEIDPSAPNNSHARTNLFKRRPLNGTILAFPTDNDQKCSAGPVIGPWMDSNSGVKNDCIWHDNMYSNWNCNATSWLVPLPLPCPVINVILVVKIVNTLL